MQEQREETQAQIKSECMFHEARNANYQQTISNYCRNNHNQALVAGIKYATKEIHEEKESTAENGEEMAVVEGDPCYKRMALTNLYPLCSR